MTGTRAIGVAEDGGRRHPPDGLRGWMPSAESVCHLRGCEAHAATRCASCKRWFCAHHVCTVLVEQRGDRSETPGHRGLLERVPSHTETYRVCVRCRKRPIDLQP